MLLRDVTEQVRTADVLARRYRLERFVTSLSTRFLNLADESVDDAIHEALAEVAEIVEVDRGYVMRVNEDDDRLEYTHEWQAEDVPPDVPPKRFLLDAKGPLDSANSIGGRGCSIQHVG